MEIRISGLFSIVVLMICVSVFLIPVVLAAIYGTKRNWREAKLIQRNIDKGVFEKWDKTKSRRFKLMVFSQIILLLSFFVWIGTGLLDASNIFSPFRLVILALIFIIMFILGFAINRKLVNGE